MSLKEESPLDKGISDVPDFSETRESTAKSTPPSTLSNDSNGSPRKDLQDDADDPITISTAAANIASVTLPSDDMPATPFSLATTPRHSSPQSADLADPRKDAPDDSAAAIVTDSVTVVSVSGDEAPNVATRHPLATPPEARSITPAYATDDMEADSGAPVSLTLATVPSLTPEDSTVASEASAGTSASPVSAEFSGKASDAPFEDTASRQNRRSSRRVSAAAAAIVSNANIAQPATSSPSRRPAAMARTIAQHTSESPKPVETATKAVAKPVAKPAAKPAPKSAKSRASLPAEIERRVTRHSDTHSQTFSVSSSLGKRGRRHSEKPANVPREILRLQDTKEFSHIDENPIVYTVWSNGKYVPANAAGEPLVDKKATQKTNKTGKAAYLDANAESCASTTSKAPGCAEEEATEEEDPAAAKPAQPRHKTWLDRGLYAGQPMPKDPTFRLTTAEKRELAKLPELTKPYPPNKTLPMPIFNGLRMLIHGRDFKMPYDVFNPLPPGQPKPIKYGRFSKNRFVGEAHAIWRKNPDYDDLQSKCVCKPATGCDEDCQNRIMLYECDDGNCNVGPERCHNREFQRLAERTASKNLYHIGVEVFKTPNRGHGIRASRSFRPGQIIMEYIGEIITEEESDRRMNELYKNNACYYLMSFDQSLIIDGTSGSIARFVNHSCAPNCRMIKWIVSGQPRIALFAGDRPIMTGEELTYDYNFDPYSSKNVQSCLCGSENCRGILGPRKSDKVSKAAEKAAAEKANASAGKQSGNGKRKLDADEDKPASGPAQKKMRASAGSRRGPGRPRTDEVATKTKTLAKVTTTKAALAALMAKEAKEARAARAAKAKKAARLAKAAEAAGTTVSTKSSKAAKPSKASPPSKTPNVTKGGKATKSVKATTMGGKATTTAKSPKAAKTKKTGKAASTATSKKSDGTNTTKIAKSTKTAKKAAGNAIGASPKQNKKRKATYALADNTDEDMTPIDVRAKGGPASQATAMARALAKAAKEAAKAKKAVQTASKVAKIKPNSVVAKRATALATEASKRAGKAKTALKKTAGAPTAKASEKIAKTAKKTGKAVLQATPNSAKESVAEASAPSVSVMDMTDAPTVGESSKPTEMGTPVVIDDVAHKLPRRKPGRPLKTNIAKTATAMKKAATAAPVAVVAKRPVGRPPGSKKAVKPAVLADVSSAVMNETVAERPDLLKLALEAVEGDATIVRAVPLEDVIHVASAA